MEGSCKIVFAILGIAPFQMKEMTILSTLLKKIFGIGIGVCLKRYVNLGKMDILKRLSCPTGVRGRDWGTVSLSGPHRGSIT